MNDIEIEGRFDGAFDAIKEYVSGALLSLSQKVKELETQIQSIPQPIKGEMGEPGPKGESIVGPPGPAGKDGKDGADGHDGKDGRDGKDGKDGESIIVLRYVCGRVRREKFIRQVDRAVGNGRSRFSCLYQIHSGGI